MASLDDLPELTDRQLFVEELVARRMRSSQVVAEVRKRFDVSQATVYRDMDAVRARWLRESVNIDRETRRRELRYAMEDTLNRALDAQVAARDPEGKPILNKDTGEPFMIPDPNLGAAARLLDTLARLDGLYQFPLELKVQENVEKLLDTVKGHMTREAYEQLVRAIAAASGAAAVGSAGAGGAGDGAAG